MAIEVSTSRPWSAGIAAAKANFLPGLILWIVGVAVLVAWFTWPPAQQFLQHVADIKNRYGFFYSIPSTAFFAGALPFLMQGLAKNEGERHDMGMFWFLVIFWAYKGFEIDLLYRLQTLWFGDGHSVGTLATKIFVDQFVYCPLFAVPVSALLLEWAQAGFRREVLLSPLSGWTNFREWYARQSVPVLISNWGVWIPSVAIIYTLPPALQLPIQNLICCMWVMMMIFMTKPAEAQARADAA